jgi:hypothetical protein
VGCQFYQERQGHYFLLPIQVEHLDLALRALGNMKEEDDPMSFAQANFFIGKAYTYTQSVGIGKRYLRKAMQTVRRYGIRFVQDSGSADPNGGSPFPEPAEIICERFMLLGELLYTEVVFYMFGQPTVQLDFHQEEYFRSEIPVRSST